ncbi:hypothetical protein Tco_1260278 [Tanacetum coccineum]
MAAPPSPNHVFKDEPHDFDDPDLDFEEDPQKEFEEDPEKEPKEDPDEEPKKASEMEVDDEANWDEEMNESDLIFFPYEEVGSPKPPPPESSDSETEMTAEGDHVQRVAREGTRVEACTYDFYKEMVQAGVVGVRPGEAIDVLAVYGESQPPKP